MTTTWTAITETLSFPSGTLVHTVTGRRTSTNQLGTTELAIIACEPTFPALAVNVQPAGRSYPAFLAPCPACAAANHQPIDADLEPAVEQPKLSAAQEKTLRAIQSRGGEINGYARQRGISTLSFRPLVRLGLLEKVKACAPCRVRYAGDQETTTPCERPLGDQKGGHRCYDRHRLTDAGRAALRHLDQATTPESTAAPASSVQAQTDDPGLDTERSANAAVRPMLDLATAHLPAHLGQDGLNEHAGVTADPLQHGWLLYVPLDPQANADDYAYDGPDGVPPEVLAIQLYARALGCDYVLLDVGGPHNPDLPTWDW